MTTIVEISTDGSVLTNPGPGGWAALFRYRDNAKVIYGFEAGVTTNNRMELTAPIKALEHLSRPCSIILNCDSEYVVNGITKWITKWKKNNFKTSQFKLHGGQDVKNADLWMRLDQARERHTIQWVWVRGHDSHEDNNLCDKMARDAALSKTEGSQIISVPKAVCIATTRSITFEE